MATSGQGIGYTGEDALEEYISAHIDAESAQLRNLYRQTNLKMLNPRMASGHIQGRLLKMLVSMVKPKDGMVHTVEIDDELEDFITKEFEKSPFRNRICLHIGDALKVVPELGLMFDMIFLDGEKREYPDYYNTLLDWLRPGGYMIADNTLWDGHVVDAAYSSDPQTMAVKKFNDMVHADARVEVAMIPIRDGLSLIRRIN